jgi:hypothetical protein
VPTCRLLAVLTSDPEGPVVRHRWRIYEAALRGEGVQLEVVPWPKEREGRRRAFHRAAVADGVVVSSRLLRVTDTRTLRRHARRLLFDFDDALCFRDSARGAEPSWTRERRFRTLVRSADLVTAGNRYLARLARNAGHDAEVVPTVVEVPENGLPPEPPPRPPVLGWIGSRATLPYLESQWPVLSTVVTTGRTIRLRVIADEAPRLPPGIAVDLVPWTLEGWRRALADIHVGVAPLPSDAWTRGKCGLKVLQMMSVGRPVIASAVGVQCLQVRQGETGYVVNSPAEFLERLLNLLEDPSLRARMGAQALAAVRAEWSVAAWAPRLLPMLLDWLA